MAKPKTFNPDICLDQAAILFARHGYEGASLALLCSELGIGKQSLYDTFGDKRTLLSAAMKRSTQNFAGSFALHNSARNGRQRIEDFFAVVLRECADPSHPGCLISNLLLEKAGSDKDIESEARSYWMATKRALQSVIARGQQDQSISSTEKPELLAESLMMLLSGLRLANRAGSSLTQHKQATRLWLEKIL